MRPESTGAEVAAASAVVTGGFAAAGVDSSAAAASSAGRLRAGLNAPCFASAVSSPPHPESAVNRTKSGTRDLLATLPSFGSHLAALHVGADLELCLEHAG